MSVGKILVLSILFQATIAQAVPAVEVYTQRFRPHIEAVKTKLEAQNLLHARTPVTQVCLRRYDRLFNDNELNITLGLGYYDNRPGGNAVQDPTMDVEISRALLAPCTANQSACGFTQLRTDPSDKVTKLFGKRITGPDQKQRVIKIRIFHATDNINDDFNRTSPAQVTRSEEVEAAFRFALKNSDIIFYLGHSRDGGGPDFDPPRLLPDLHVDYNWYHKNKTDLMDYLAEIKSRSTPPKLLGLLSCSSAMHFSAAVRRTAPEAGLLLSLNTINQGQMFEGVFTLINGIQRFKCESQLSADLNAVNIDHTKVGNQERSLLQFRSFPPP